MRFDHVLRRAARLPAWKLMLLVEAACWLLLARAALVLLPFQRIGRYLGSLQAPADDEPCSAAEGTVAARVGRAVDAVADRVPLRMVCLPRALAGWQMLHRRGIDARLHFGALPRSSTGSAGLMTHAWLSCGGVEVTGYPVAHGCVELGYFGRRVQHGKAKAPAAVPTR